MTHRDTDPLPLDGETPLSSNEIDNLRRMLREDERNTWAFRKLKVIVPFVVATVVGIWQLWEWVRAHVTFK